MRKIIFAALLGILFLSGCGGKPTEPGNGFEMMGPGSGMSMRHHAPVPDKYANLQSPKLPDSEIASGG